MNQKETSDRPTSVKRAPHRLLADPHYPALKEHVIRATGLDYYATRDEELSATMGRRIAELALSGCCAYLELLEETTDGQSERDRLVESLTIGETFFFRHKEMFDALRDRVLPELIEGNRDSRRLRIWSAGCSIGAEAYSVSMLLKRELSHAVRDWDIALLGTDINRRFLNRARAAAFEEWALRSVPPDVRDECLCPRDGGWELAPRYREGVRFQYHNLVEDPFRGPEGAGLFDLILCRNVMIYFNHERISRVIDGLHDCLAGGGWLLVGYAEPHVEMFRKFETVNVPGAVLYQKPVSAPLGTLAHGFRTSEKSAIVGLVPRPSWPTAAHGVRSTRNRKNGRTRFEHSPGDHSAGQSVHWQPNVEPASEKAERLAAVRLFVEEGNLQSACDACRELLAAFKLDASVHFHHGLVLNEMHLVDDALQAFKCAIYLDRQHASAHYRLGLIHLGHGRIKVAERSFRTVRDLLVRRNPRQIVADSDGLTVAELSELACSQLGGCGHT